MGKYVKPSIDKKLADHIQKFIEAHPELGYGSLTNFVEDAMRRRGEALGMFSKLEAKEEATEKKTVISEPTSLLVAIRKEFSESTFLSMKHGEGLTPHQLNYHELANEIKKYLIQRAESEGITLTEQQLRDWTKDLVKHHKHLSLELALATSHF